MSQLVDSASGIHARHNPYYIRTVRADKKDPLAKAMVEAQFPVEDDVMKPEHTYVFSFPMKADPGAVYRTDMTAIEQLELWLKYQKHWCEHKPSVTISVKENEGCYIPIGHSYENCPEQLSLDFIQKKLGPTIEKNQKKASRPKLKV